MVCNPSAPARTLAAMAACPRMPFTLEAEAESCNARRGQPSGVTDILTIGANPTLGVYLSGLFERFAWTISRAWSCANALEFLQETNAAVAVCEEFLPDGAWQDMASGLGSVPKAPALVVIGNDRALWDEVVALGGFDVLARPLRETDVIWTVASAWHDWMKRFGSPPTGGARCSDA
jgi:hypothetical protein